MAEEAMANIHDSQNGLPHFVSRAKRVIFLFMHGGPSHIDTFDHKPLLKRDHGKPLPFAKPRVQFAKTGNLLASPWEFKQHGQSGHWEYFRWIEFVDREEQPSYHPQYDAETKKQKGFGDGCLIM